MALAKKPITFKNAVNPLTWNVPIVNKDGSPTEEFQRKWLQQATTNASIVNLTTAAGVSAVLDLITSLVGSLLVRGTTRWQGLPSPADATMFLNGAAAPAFAKVKDTDLAVTDVVGNNVSIAAHGFAPKAPNDATKYLDGTGAYSTPPTGGGAASIQDDGTAVYIALSDTDGQLVLDGAGDPIFSPEVFSISSIPALPYAPSTLNTRQILLSGATYNTPAGVRQILIRFVGGGGGSSGSSTLGDGGAGTAGTDSVFNAYHAKGGAASNNVGTGSGYSGNGADGAGATSVFRRNGESSVTVIVNAAANSAGSNGGNTPLGSGAFNLQNAAANTGAGAGGAGIVAAVNAQPTAGGGGAEYVELIINSPAVSYAITVGTGGTGGAAGTNGLAGKAGGSGIIIVDEFH